MDDVHQREAQHAVSAWCRIIRVRQLISTAVTLAHGLVRNLWDDRLLVTLSLFTYSVEHARASRNLRFRRGVQTRRGLPFPWR